MASWQKPKNTSTTVPVQSLWQQKSFANAIRGENSGAASSGTQHADVAQLLQASAMPVSRLSPTSRLHSPEQNSVSSGLNLINVQPAFNHLETLQQRLTETQRNLREIDEAIHKLDSMLHEDHPKLERENLEKTRAVSSEQAETLRKASLSLEREVRRSQHLKELTEEINDDSDDLFNLIELERVKNAEEYEQQLRQEQNKSPSASSTSSSSENESDRPSNTTPEPSRTPTMFNVNASEFKPSSKSPKTSEPSSHMSFQQLDPSTQKVTYHQPGFTLFYPIRPPMSNNVVMLPQLYIPQ